MSNTIHLNITLPRDLALKIQTSRNKSALIAELLQEKFAREEKAELALRLLKAYQQSALEDQKTNDDWDVATGDGF